MITVLLAAYISTGMANGDTLSTKKLAENYKMFYNPPAVLISPPEYPLPAFIPVPFLMKNDSNYWRYEEKRPASGPKDPAENIKRLDSGLRQKK